MLMLGSEAVLLSFRISIFSKTYFPSRFFS